MDLTTLKPYENLSYGPLKPNVNLEPDFFTDFTPLSVDVKLSQKKLLFIMS